MSSAYGDFEFNTTGKAAEGWYQYSLDGSTWSGCANTLRLGPLSVGAHSLQLRTISADGGSVSAVVTFGWTIIAASDSQLAFSGLDDGGHSLLVAATDPLQHVETAPRTYAWIVDTVPPLTNAVLGSRYHTNASTSTVNVSCGGEAYPDLCQYCWSQTVGGVTIVADTCSAVGAAVVEVQHAGDGVTTVLIAAVDGAGNRSPTSVNVTWIVDTVPATVTAAAVVSATVWVPAIASFVVNSSTIAVAVTVSEDIATYLAFARRQGASDDSALPATVTSASGTALTVAVPLQGYVVVTLYGIDATGNVPANGTSLELVIVAAPPGVAVTGPSPPLTNVSSVAVNVTALDADLRVLAYYSLSWSPPLAALPTTLPVSQVAEGVATLVLADAASAAYHLTVTAVDVLGSHGPPARVAFTVDRTPPQSRFASPLPSFQGANDVVVHVVGSDELSYDGMLLQVLHVAGANDVSASGQWLSQSNNGSDATAFVFSGLPQGRHTFYVRAVDGAGNAQTAAADVTSTVVDTIAPVVAVTTAPSHYTNVVNQTMCVSVDDATATPANATIAVDGSVVPVNSSGCVSVPLLREGNHTVSVTVTDPAGNTALPVSLWFVVDVTPPALTFDFVPGRGCYSASRVSGGAVTVCNSSAAAVFAVQCLPTPPALIDVVTSPCGARYYLKNNGSSTCSSASSTSSADSSGAGSVWSTVTGGVVDASAFVATALQAASTASVSLFVQAIDGSGNVGNVSTLAWWVDTVAPQPVTLVTVPDSVTTSTAASFVFKLASDSSPGQVSFAYALMQDGVPLVLPGGNPSIPDPAPANTDQTQVRVNAMIESDEEVVAALWLWL